MKQKTKLLILLLVLAAVLAGAFFAYRHFSKNYSPEQTPSAQISADEQTGTADNPTANAAPDFTVFDKDGSEITLSDFKGKPVIVNFWATWCPYCIMEFPNFQKMFENYGDRVSFMMIDLTDGYRETQSGAEAYISDNGYTFPVYFDLRGSASSAYAATSIPLSLFIDKDGNLVETKLGAMDEGTLESYIQTLINQ